MSGGKKASIPDMRAGSDLVPVLRACKHNLEVIMGRRVDPIEELSDSATTADIIAKINEIIRRLQ